MPLAGAFVRASDIPGGVGCRLRRAANQSINNVVTTSISWDTEDLDTHGFIAVTSTTVTIPTGLDGLYAITFVPLPAVAPATRFITQVVVTTAITGMATTFRATGGAGENFMYVGITVPLLAADTFLCQVFQQNGAAVNFTAWLACYRMGVS